MLKSVRRSRSRRPSKGATRRRQNGAMIGGPPAKMLQQLTSIAAGREHFPRLLPFPDRLRCVLTYTELVTLVNNSASVGIQQFCLNDLFDPNFTGSGAQPLWFDQLSSLYNRYRVYASAIHVRVMCPTTDGTTYGRVCLAPSAATAASLSYADIEAMPRAKFTAISADGISAVTMTHAATVSEVAGVKDVEGADRLQAQVSASPSERVLWVLAGQSHVPAITAVTIVTEVRISYMCEFFDRKAVALSLEQKGKPASTQEFKANTPSAKTPQPKYVMVEVEEAHAPLSDAGPKVLAKPGGKPKTA